MNTMDTTLLSGFFFNPFYLLPFYYMTMVDEFKSDIKKEFEIIDLGLMT